MTFAIFGSVLNVGFYDISLPSLTGGGPPNGGGGIRYTFKKPSIPQSDSLTAPVRLGGL